ncbi:MAG: amino acid permease, partial [Clostridia bacterium]|nr:amino acid permease [Clostridia bacterium]
MQQSGQVKNSILTPFMSPVAVWALSLGTTIGWGSLVVTSNNYLSNAGPLGSVLGLMIGMAVMLFIGRNYSYMMERYPDAGGAYTFLKETYGYDQGFLTAWFLFLTYISVFWANATSLPLFARYFLGGIFKFGYLYSIFDYDVYIGEMLLTIAAIVLFSVLCMNFKRLLAHILVALGILMTLGIAVCFFAAISGHGSTGFSYAPLFTGKGSALSQTIRIACISPWAFIGFENISHMTEEYTFPVKKVRRILICSLFVSTALYVFITLLSVTAYPPEYGSWFEYIQNIGKLEGIKGLPAFYAAHHYLGSHGVTILILTLLALIITSLIGNMLALSRLTYALAKDGILPRLFAALNKKNIPWKAVCLIMAISVLIPFLGRTTIGWIVDVTTIGSTIVYGFVSASALKQAKKDNDKYTVITGLIGMIVMTAFGLYLLIPELFVLGSIERETYFLFTIWAILGFAFFRYILKQDHENRFGKSIVVWIALLSLILFTSLVWLSKSTMSITNGALDSVHDFFASILDNSQSSAALDNFVNSKLTGLRQENFRSILVVTGFFAVSIFILLNNYSLMKTRMLKSEMELEHAKKAASTDPLTGVKSKLAYAEGERIINEEIDAGLINEFAIAVCDVNGLKHINDTLGHKAGDEYIKAACKFICDHVVYSPVYRIGGDEFVVILTGADYANRREIIDKLNKGSEAAVKNGGAVVSVGISDFMPGRDEDFKTVFERADALMYERKKQL